MKKTLAVCTVVLHGRDAGLDRTSFIARLRRKNAERSPRVDSTRRLRSYQQCLPLGRGGRRLRSALHREATLSHRRIPDHVWGFSMGGAGAWHLGLHYPDQWSSVGAGAGFSDTVKYLNLKRTALAVTRETGPHLRRFRIRDERSECPDHWLRRRTRQQIAASQLMNARGKAVGVEFPVLNGPQTEHKFHPDSWKEFLAFHTTAAEKGRPSFPGHRELRFTTCTVKYNQCEWLSVEEQIEPYEPSVVEAKIDDNGVVHVRRRTCWCCR